MTYLVTHPSFPPFYSKYYDYENMYVAGMIIYNTTNYTYTTNGIDWMEIEMDHL